MSSDEYVRCLLSLKGQWQHFCDLCDCRFNITLKEMRTAKVEWEAQKCSKPKRMYWIKENWDRCHARVWSLHRTTKTQRPCHFACQPSRRCPGIVYNRKQSIATGNIPLDYLVVAPLLFPENIVTRLGQLRKKFECLGSRRDTSVNSVSIAEI